MEPKGRQHIVYLKGFEALLYKGKKGMQISANVPAPRVKAISHTVIAQSLAHSVAVRLYRR